MPLALPPGLVAHQLLVVLARPVVVLKVPRLEGWYRELVERLLLVARGAAAWRRQAATTASPRPCSTRICSNHHVNTWASTWLSQMPR
jgi:hypothetical protein